MPDDDAKLQAIEKRLDPDTSRALALSGSAGTFAIAPRNMGELMEFAKLMALSGPCVRPAFRGKVGACLAIALQAFRTGADPFAVANKAYITTSRSGDEQIAYEAQYIHAVVNGSGQLAKRLRANYSGQGGSRKCLITGYVRGEEDALEYESPTIDAIGIKNSPLWKSDPDQQLFYYSTRAWARRHLPEVVLGMYTPDEIAAPIDITPARETPPRPMRNDFITPTVDEIQTATDGSGFANAPDLPLHVMERELPVDEDIDEETGEIAETRQNSRPAQHPKQKGDPAVAEGPADGHSPKPAGDEQASEERAEFWSGAKLEVKQIPLPGRTGRADWQRTQMELLYWINDARSADELAHLQADSKRTLDGLKLAYVRLYDEVIVAFAKRRAELEAAP